MPTVGGLEGSMTLSPVIFVAGPSGAGKSEVSKWVEADLRFLHLDIDIHYPFGTHRLRREWDKFSNQLDPAPLASELRRRIDDASRSGAVLSIPSTTVLTREQIDVARSVGICTVVLWGFEELCKEARRERDHTMGLVVLDEERYDKSNRKAFDTYGSSEYADIRVEAFCPDGSRWSREHIVRVIGARLAG